MCTSEDIMIQHMKFITTWITSLMNAHLFVGFMFVVYKKVYAYNFSSVLIIPNVVFLNWLK